MFAGWAKPSRILLGVGGTTPYAPPQARKVFTSSNSQGTQETSPRSPYWAISNQVCLLWPRIYKLQLETAGQPFSNYAYNYLASGNAAHGTGPTVHADLEPARRTLRPRISWTCAPTAMVPPRRSGNIRSGAPQQRFWSGEPMRNPPEPGGPRGEPGCKVKEALYIPTTFRRCTVVKPT